MTESSLVEEGGVWPPVEGCRWELVGKDWTLLEQDTVMTLEKGGVRPLKGRDGLCGVEINTDYYL